MLLDSNIIIYAAQPAHDSLTLVTHNTGDFVWITGLKVLDPLA